MTANRIGTSGSPDTTGHDIMQRPGVTTLVSLVATLCLLVLGMLMAGMASSSMVSATTRRDAVSRSYECESVASEFVACLDAEVSHGVSLADAASHALDATKASGHTGADGATASVDEGGTCHAMFPCDDRRRLEVSVRIGDSGRPVVTEWRLKAVPNEDPSMGTLLGT